ncbi:hypothetical protein SCHPADRAFT_903618 [Schizopora paradoxa]|uniref:Uncharacterized protein n=1 Tax=Schizopora paradoxa TaxID=27342 RepID=A0A0H2RQ27_9AGAM|nr:hypothetical protein SCHPADRAFT_903618 [Schizopora paradoxa]
MAQSATSFGNCEVTDKSIWHPQLRPVVRVLEGFPKADEGSVRRDGTGNSGRDAPPAASVRFGKAPRHPAASLAKKSF